MFKPPPETSIMKQRVKGFNLIYVLKPLPRHQNSEVEVRVEIYILTHPRMSSVLFYGPKPGLFTVMVFFILNPFF